MIIYNVTTKVDNSIVDEWLKWMKEVHIPEVLNTSCFVSHLLLQLIEVDDTDGPTYAIQYTAESKALYNRYIAAFAAEMRKKVADKWGQKVIAFRSVLQMVD
jgi:hypothetical protein